MCHFAFSFQVLTFFVSKFTKPKLYASEPNQAPKAIIPFSMWKKGFVVSQRAFGGDDTEASFEVLSFPSSLTFTPSSYIFFPPLWVMGVVSPFQRFRTFSRGLSSDRSLFPVFVSVICGHYINSHGWPEE